MLKKKATPYAFLAPTILVLFVLSYLPMPYAFMLALSRTVPGSGELQFVGMDNFKIILRDKNFWESLANTLKYAGGSVVLLLVMGLILALLFNKKIRFGGLYLTIIFIPWVVSDVFTGMTWKWMLDPSYGILNYLLSWTGLKASVMLTDPKFAMVGLWVVTLWKSLAYTTLLILAGLQNISHEYIEASQLDGCSPLQSLWHITLPILRSTMLVTGLLIVIQCINQTAFILVMTNGGPIRDTETLGLYMYKEAFVNYHLTNAAAIAVVLAVLNILIVALYFVLNRKSALASE